MNNPAFILRGFIGAMVAIGLIGWLSTHLPPHWVLLVGSFGASSVIVFSLPHTKAARPKALLLGNLLGASIGVAVVNFVPLEPWFLAALAVAGAIAVMAITDTIHPPGGAAALIAVHGAQGAAEGWYFIIAVMIGAVILGATAYAAHNLPGPGRVGYPARDDSNLS